MSHPDTDPIESVWADVGEAVPEDPKWIVKDMIPTGVTFLAGPPKSYKSTVELAVCLTACGVQNSVLPGELSQCEETGIVMGLSGEASAGVLRHTAKLGFGVDIPPDGRFRVMNDPWRFRLDQPHDVDELLHWVDRIHPNILFVDPLRNFHSLDENDSGGMVKMLQPLQQYAISNDVGVVIVHHSKKIGEDRDGNRRTANAQDMRGTSALFGLADAVLTLTGKGRSQVHIDAVFKRGESWQRTIQLGIWGTEANETIDSLTKEVFLMIAEGKSKRQIMSALSIGSTKLEQACVQLRRIGALTGEGTPTSSGRTIVESAVRRFAASI